MAKLSSAKRGALQPVRRVMTRNRSAEPRDTSPQPRMEKDVARKIREVRVTIDTDDQVEDTDHFAGLPDVEEEDEDSQRQSDEEEDQRDNAITREGNVRASIASGFSGTTAKTSFSQEEIMDLDVDIMVDALPRLYAATEDLKKTIAPSEPNPSPEVWKDIRRSGSKQNRFYNNRLNAVQLHKPDFGSEEYIQPRNVIRAMLGVQTMDDIPLAIWRPDDILFSANLVQMIDSLLITCDPSDRTGTCIDALERLDLAFPATIAGGQFDVGAVAFYLDLAAQLAIARLELHIRSEPRFTPDEVILNVLYDDEGSFRHSSALGLDKVDELTYKRALDMVSHLENDLKQPFHSLDPEEANAYLKSNFQWSHFVDHALQYFTHRKRDLDDRISAAGGMDNIIGGLTHEVARRAALRASGRTVPKYAKRKRNSSAASTKALEKELLQDESTLLSIREKSSQIGDQADVGGIGQTDSLHAPLADIIPSANIQQANMTFEDDDYVPVGDQPDDTDEQQEVSEPMTTHRASPAKMISEFSALRATQKAHADHKSKSLLDKQQNAVRISLDHSQVTQGQSSQADVHSTSKGRKQTSTTVEDPAEMGVDEEPEAFDPTQDVGFQTDTRDTAAADRRRREAPSYDPLSLTPTRPPSSSTAARPASTSVGKEARQTTTAPSPKRQRKNPGSSIPAKPRTAEGPDEDLPPSTVYQEAKFNAKINRVIHKQPKTQTRTPWSEEEEEALVGLIENECDDGISYAEIKRIDEANGRRLHLRDAEAIRFKARNMKVTLLRAYRTIEALPANWEKVVLDKKGLQTLRDHGINIQQDPVRNTGKG